MASFMVDAMESSMDDATLTLILYHIKARLRRRGLTPACGSAHARNDHEV